MSTPSLVETAINQLRTLLRNLPADSPEWNEESLISEFLDELDILRQNKLKEREAIERQQQQQLVQRALLGEQLRQLQASPPATLAFFDIADAWQWTQERVPADRLEAVIETIHDLLNIFHNHETLSARAQRSLTAKRQVESEIGQLERDYEIAKHFLRQIFPEPTNPEASRKPMAARSQPAVAPAPTAAPPTEVIPPTPPAEPRPQPPASEPAAPPPPAVVAVNDDTPPAPVVEPRPQPPASEPAAPPAPTVAAVNDDTPPAAVAEPVLSPSAIVAAPPPHQTEAVQTPPPAETALTPQPGPSPAVETEAAVTPLTPEAQLRFLWHCVSQDDLPAAYWVARSLTNQTGIPPTPPAELLAALQGSLWLSHMRGVLLQDMLSLAYDYRPGSSRTERLLATAAALLPSLIAPDSNFSSWLSQDPGLPAGLNTIIEAVREFSYGGQPLRPELTQRTHSAAEQQQQLAQYQKDAKEWLKTAPQRRPGFKRGGDVWRHWTGNNGLLRRMITEVASGNTRHTADLEAFLDQWHQYTPQQWIDRTDYECSGRAPSSTRRIDGKVRDYLLNYANEAVELAEGWLVVAQAGSKQTPELQRRANLLMREIKAGSGALAELERLEHDAPFEMPVGDAPATLLSAPIVRVLRNSLQATLTFLGLAETTAGGPADYPAGLDPQGLYWGLLYRLMLVPDIGVPDDPRSEPRHVDQAAALLSIQHDPAKAFAAFIDRSDYRFAPVLIENMSSKQGDTNRLRLEEARIYSRRYTIKTYDELNLQTEQAVVDGLIDETERAELNHRLEAIRNSSSDNFGQLDQELRSVRQHLDKARNVRLQQQTERWKRIIARLEKTHFNTQNVEAYTAIANFITELSAKGDIVVLDERLARLEEVLDQGGTPALREIAIQPQADIYQNFIDTLRQWESGNTQELFRTAELLNHVRRNAPKTLETLQISNLDRPRREQFEKALDSWHWLKQEGKQNRERMPYHVAVLMRDYLGFTLARPAVSEAVSLNERGSDWAYLTFSMSLGDLSPLPQFGSLQGDRYDVVVLWERPSADTIGARLDSLKLRANSVLVIFLGILSTRDRLDQLRYNRQKPQAVAILDQYMLLYLGRQKRARLPVFFNCALPLARINPYAETGPVTLEMFKGREAELNNLMEPLGSSLVYGGRQLGKSALFQAVQRQFHNPRDERYVLLEDIKTIGDQVSQQPDPDQVWERLRAGLAKFGLLKPHTGKLEASTTISQIAAMMNERANRRVLILLDEADNFLTADQVRNFEVVSRLKALMDSTQRRFKIIFAGLHNVQRYVNVANQPLAHLIPLEIQPLDPAAARRLIVEPLETLGFRFEDERPILSILAYSNSHPGLIQLLCHRLLEKLYRQPVTQLGPYRITRDHVEDVYRQREVQDGIRRRFEWTLALDPRYKALAEIMVYEQLQDRDSYARTFGASELLEISLEYWRQAFEQTDRSEFKGYLDEMVGLGVLVRTQEDTYRLRSPNLVRLMGSLEDIEASLSDLANRSIPPAFEPDSHRAALDEKMRRYSPFTFAQERVLMAPRAGVCLIFGSPALRIDAAVEAVKKQFVPSERGRVSEISLPASSGDALSWWLKQEFDKTHRAGQNLLLYRRLSSALSHEDMMAQVRATAAFLHRHRRSRDSWLRVLFLFDAEATLEWLRLPVRERQQLEETEVSAVVALRRWDRIGVEQRLHQHGKMAVERVVRRIEAYCDGWPLLLDKLADTWENNQSDDPLYRIDELESQIQSGEVNPAFLRAAGCDVAPAVRRVLETTVAYRSVPEKDAIPSVLDERLSPDECTAIVEYLKRLRLVDVVGGDLRPNTVIDRLLTKS